MQPARADVVHHLTFPASAATTGVRHGTSSMSIPCVTALGARVAEVHRVRVVADQREDDRLPVRRGRASAPRRRTRRRPRARSAARMRRETPRAVVRWRVMAPVRRAKGGTYQTSGKEPAGTHAGRGVVRVTRVKIAVCVKQVPDATVHKRLDPATNRLDRSGEGALNATDVNAVEEALRLKEAHGRRGRRRLARAGEGDGLAPQGARDGRRPRRARLRRRGRRLRSRGDEPRARARRSSARRPTSSSSGSSRATPTARCCGPPSPTGCAGRWCRRSRS